MRAYVTDGLLAKYVLVLLVAGYKIDSVKTLILQPCSHDYENLGKMLLK